MAPPPFPRNDPRYAQMLNAIFARAVAAHQAGQIDAAAALYRQILDYEKRQFDAMHMLAVIAGQKGDLAEGVQLLTRAIRENQNSPDAYLNLGRMQGEQKIPLKSDSDEYGVKQPGIFITVYRSAGAAPLASYAAGNITPDGYGRYLLPVGSAEIVTVPEFHITNLLGLIDAMKAMAAAAPAAAPAAAAATPAR